MQMGRIVRRSLSWTMFVSWAVLVLPTVGGAQEVPLNFMGAYLLAVE